MAANNMKAICDALKKIVELTTPCEGVTSIELQVQAEAITALSIPPRECDMFADEKQADALHAAFIEHCNRCDCPMGCDHRKNPRFLLDGNCASILKCFARFALSKATPKKGGAK